MPRRKQDLRGLEPLLDPYSPPPEDAQAPRRRIDGECSGHRQHELQLVTLRAFAGRAGGFLRVHGIGSADRQEKE
jgi:hypothetical protein